MINEDRMKNPYLHLVSTAWQYAVGQRVRMVVVYIMFIIANIIEMAEPFVFGKLLNTVQVGGPTMLHDSTVWLTTYVSLSFFFWIFHGNARVWERDMSYLIVSNFKDSAYKAVSSLPLKWHKDNHSGATINRIGKAARAVENFTDESYIFIQTIVKFFISLTAILYFLPSFGFVPLLIGVLIIIAIFSFDKYIIRIIDAMNEQYHLIAATLHDYLSNIGTVITLRLESLTRGELVRKIMIGFPIYKKLTRINEIKWFSISMGLSVVSFFVIYTYIRSNVIAGNVIMIGSLMTLYQYTDKFINVFYDLAWKYEKLVMINADLHTVDAIFDAYARLERSDKKLKRPRDWQTIEISGLNFKYEDDQNDSAPLKNIAVSLRRGMRIAFVGESGSGKSTMLALLRGLFDAKSGGVIIDGREFHSLRVLSEWVTLIPQDPEIFENSIEYNVTVGVKHTKKEVMDAVNQARFDRVLTRLPRGLATNIKEKGVNLSGGEKQRLAVARGLFAGKSSSILLLDEPTSSMDPQNEMGIYKNIFTAFPQACVVSSVHRLNLLKQFDMIYLFEHGKIVESGDFNALLKKKKHFATMWKNYLHHEKR